MYERVSKALKLSSQFKPYILALIAEKQGMGHKYCSESDILRLFDKFIVEHGFSDTVITKEILESWSLKRPHESNKTHRMRFWIVQQLSRYMVKIGFDSYVSPFEMKKGNSGFNPYIFTDAEQSHFLEYAYGLDYSPYSPHRHWVIPMLFTLLACTGLRLSEALKLLKSDVSFSGENAILYIYGTKFDKDRLVPLAPVVSADFKRYLDKLELLCPKSKFVFPAKDNGRYSRNAIYGIYRKILWKAGISHGGRGRGPRIHDFGRHTFAVKALRKMALENVDMLAALPLLCKYMGHKNIQSTQTYITLTAEVFPHITAKIEAVCGNIVPALGVQYE